MHEKEEESKTKTSGDLTEGQAERRGVPSLIFKTIFFFYGFHLFIYLFPGSFPSKKAFRQFFVFSLSPF